MKKIIFVFVLVFVRSFCLAQDNYSVRNGEITLPATLCMAGGDDTPIVVFVHGSGPSDRDETVGPNKMFRQLAELLQSRGVSSLRYDKRTFIYKQGADTITYKEETVDDAVTAVRQLKAEGYKHVFVAGHSLGGHCIPLIAEKCDDVIDGVIIMSGNVLSLEDALKAQLNYLGKLYGASEAQIQMGVNQALAALPDKYLEYDRTYSPLPLAKKIIADYPALRWMVIGCGHDYQVTMADFYMWQMNLGNAATYYFGETLDHMLRSLPQMATSQDYLVEGAVDTAVVEAIVRFITTSSLPKHQQ